MTRLRQIKAARELTDGIRDLNHQYVAEYRDANGNVLATISFVPNGRYRGFYVIYPNGTYDYGSGSGYIGFRGAEKTVLRNLGDAVRERRVLNRNVIPNVQDTLLNQERDVVKTFVVTLEYAEAYEPDVMETIEWGRERGLILSVTEPMLVSGRRKRLISRVGMVRRTTRLVRRVRLAANWIELRNALTGMGYTPRVVATYMTEDNEGYGLNEEGRYVTQDGPPNAFVVALFRDGELERYVGFLSDSIVNGNLNEEATSLSESFDTFDQAEDYVLTHNPYPISNRIVQEPDLTQGTVDGWNEYQRRYWNDRYVRNEDERRNRKALPPGKTQIQVDHPRDVTVFNPLEENDRETTDNGTIDADYVDLGYVKSVRLTLVDTDEARALLDGLTARGIARVVYEEGDSV